MEESLVLGVAARAWSSSLRSEIWLNQSWMTLLQLRQEVLVIGDDGLSTVCCFRGGTDGCGVEEDRSPTCVLSVGAQRCLGSSSQVVVKTIGPVADAVSVKLLAPLPLENMPSIRQSVLIELENITTTKGCRLTFGAAGNATFLVEEALPAGPVRIVSSTKLELTQQKQRDAHRDASELETKEKVLYELIRKFHRAEGSQRVVLVYGASGSGKTKTIQTVLRRIQHPTFELVTTRLLRPETGQGERYMEHIFNSAIQSMPSTVIIEDLDSLRGDRRIVTALLGWIDRLQKSCGYSVGIVATATSETSIPEKLFGTMKIYHRIALGPKSLAERQKLLQSNLQGFTNPDDLPEIVERISARTPGYSASDLCRLVSLAQLSEVCRIQAGQKIRLSKEALVEMTMDLKPTALAGCPWWRPVPEAGGKKLFGLEDELLTLETCMKEHLLGVRKDLKTIRAALVLGQPGSGKSALVAELCHRAAEYSNSVVITAADIVSSTPGASERAIKDVFRFARSAAPAILVIESVETLAPSRSGENVRHSSRQVLTGLLTQIDGIFSENYQQQVFTLSTTTDKDAIDHALLRPGRIELQIQTDKINLRAKEDIFREEIPSGISLAAVRERLVGMTGAEIRGFCLAGRRTSLVHTREKRQYIADDGLE
ncbi:hypothetical protein NDN08_001192 [Rhodosorus marinus]|uniref:AAA+ ATPase domain-containing protein n=1 Tax=Rhodosorus marinus TaxID=101924 RepID=A0AAV8URL4_9RHOD|nr:hypothetical protein NDN08_001192 [Rhodosorus marinus]